MDNTTSCKLPPAVLFVGSASLWKNDVERYISERKTVRAADAMRQFRWLAPAAYGYSKEQIDEALLSMQFLGDEACCSAIVCTYADLLLPAAANRLLKIMEEPHAGWHIILCVENEQAVLGTLRSRCIVQYAAVDRLMETRTDIPQFISFLYHCEDLPAAMVRFQSLREECAGSAAHTMAYLDVLLVHWNAKRPSVYDSRANKIDAVVNVLMHAYTELPMPGGELLFWRTLLLRMHHAWNSGV